MTIHDFCDKQLDKVKFTKSLQRSTFIQSLAYFQGKYDSATSFMGMHEALAAREVHGFDRTFFLSVPPSVFGSVCSMVSKYARAASPGMTRVLVEKPFGRDSRSFEKLNALTSSAFNESEIFRVDHYLAKSCIQNLVMQRISRGVYFGDIWSNKHIESLHVSWKEDIGTGGRGGYFDQSGIIRDIMQNHLLQLLTFATMEPGQSADAVVANKIDLLKAIGSASMDDAFLGQFDGYLNDDTVPEGSRCPTYAAVRLAVDNPRWQGVPMLITAGKGLSVRNCTVEARLKPHSAFDSIILCVQPEPGLWLKGPGGNIKLPFMDGMSPLDVFDYERILFDGCRGSKLLMVGERELREAWRIFTPLLNHIDSKQPQPVQHSFKATLPAGMIEFARLSGINLTTEDPLAGLRGPTPRDVNLIAYYQSSLLSGEKIVQMPTEPQIINSYLAATTDLAPAPVPDDLDHIEVESGSGLLCAPPDGAKVEQHINVKSTAPSLRCTLPRWNCSKSTLFESQLGRMLMMLQCGCCLYSAAILLPIDAGIGGATEWGNSTAILCPRESICAEGYAEVLMLFLSRGSAYFMYPMLGAVFLTKCHALNTQLSKTQISLYLPLVDLHNLHAAVGILIAAMTFIHAVFHIARLAKRGEADLLFTTDVGVSGMLGTIVMIPVVALMKLPQRLKMLVTWEQRKTAHMLSIVMAIALCWHTYRTFVFFVIILIIYAIDRGYRSFSKTYRIVDSQWRQLTNGVQLTFKNPPGWDNSQLGYINIAVPWISKSQWHPFSVYGHPTLEDHSAVCIIAAGDWTKQLYRSVSHPTTRPVWIQGPFSSPYATSMEFDNLMLVASGIGITPALSCVREHAGERRVSLLWMCRDASLLEFFLRGYIFQDLDFTIVYYTGKSTLQIPKGLPSSVSIMKGRPNIQETVAEVIRCVENGKPLPTKMMRASTNMKAKSVLFHSFVANAQTPLKQLEVLVENMLEAGISPAEIMSLFGFNNQVVELSNDHFEQGLRTMGVSELVLSSQDIIDVLGNIGKGGSVTQSEMHHFISRMGHYEIDDRSHQLRNLALQLLRVDDDKTLNKQLPPAHGRRRAAVTAQPIRNLHGGSSLRTSAYRLQQRGRVIGGLTSTVELTDICMTNTSEEDIHSMRPFLKLVEYGTGEYIMQRGDLSDGNMYVVAAGSANIVEGGIVKQTLQVGDRFGETALWLNAHRNADIQANGENVCCLTLSRDVLPKLPPDAVTRLKIGAYSAAVSGRADFASINVSVLDRLCKLVQAPGVRETYREWDLDQKGHLIVDDIHRGLSTIGIGAEQTSRVLLVDIIMDGEVECRYAGFQHALDILTQRLELVRTNSASAPYDETCNDDDDEERASVYIKNEMSAADIARWGMLYCGGSAPVVSALEKTSRELNVSYKSESFGW